MTEIPSKVIAQQHEAYRHWCPVCGDGHKPYKTATAWWGHIEKEHPKVAKDLVTKIKRSGDVD